MRWISEFLVSATSPGQFPAPGAPEFAFLGRSNTGKSSLINALVGEKAARVSSTPGRTRSINFFALRDSPAAREPRMIFADLPGYGYAKLAKSISAQWPEFINPYLAERPSLRQCICLIDSNIPAQASDQQLVEALRAMGRSFLIVGTKADRLSGNQRTTQLTLLKRELAVDDLLLCSAKTGSGVKELWGKLVKESQAGEAGGERQEANDGLA